MTTLSFTGAPLSGGVADLTQRPETLAGMRALGYGAYFLLIGLWRVLSAPAILPPRSTRLMEWAYAGAFFNFSGAVISHLASVRSGTTSATPSCSPSAGSSPGGCVPATGSWATCIRTWKSDQRVAPIGRRARGRSIRSRACDDAIANYRVRLVGSLSRVSLCGFATAWIRLTRPFSTTRLTAAT
ncbi:MULTISPECIES: DoxX family protein [unclassified Nonomuraea]|uniref:DoxX family protein n=1 Tax=unclassified Nonomuraea TaxID=2593643 RepID=UPI0013786004|nr:hypothetical protein [Nonomuraea sp. K271]